MANDWTKIRKLADHLYSIADDGACDVDKTAAEVESEMQVYLLSELGPLLEAAEQMAIYPTNRPKYWRKRTAWNNLREELDKWRK